MNKNGRNLVNFIADVAGDRYLKVEEELGEGFYRLNIAEAERRQAKHDIRFVEDVVVELLRNSRDAGAKRIFVASQKSARKVRKITVLDDGCGIPAGLRDSVFEPRVTSKLDNMVTDRYGVHGRGMALYSVRTRCQSAELLFAEPGVGCAFAITVDLSALPERKDQSTNPVVRWRNGRPQLVIGPHNILRTALEFNLEHPEIDVFLGSPGEVAATVTGLGNEANRGPGDVLPKCESGELLAQEAASLGLHISERTAQRIQSGRIKRLNSLAAKFLYEGQGEKRYFTDSSMNLAKRIQDDDLDGLTKEITEKFRKIGERYFLEARSSELTKDRDKIRLTIYLKETD